MSNVNSSLNKLENHRPVWCRHEGRLNSNLFSLVFNYEVLYYLHHQNIQLQLGEPLTNARPKIICLYFWKNLFATLRL